MAETKQNTISIPESVTINGVSYSVKDTPELQEFIQAVAKVEKSKLYSQYESLKAQLQALSNIQVTETPPTDIEKLIQSLKDTFVTKEDITKSLKSTVEEVVRPVLDATKKTQQNELDAYREKLIKENAATCIPELVKGNSKEELDASLKESIRLRAAYPSPGNAPQPYSGDPNIQKEAAQQGVDLTKSPTPNGSAPEAPAAPANTPAPQIPHRQAPDASQEQTGVRQMSMEEFSKKRDAIREQLEAAYGGSRL